MNLLLEFFRHNSMMNERLVDACRPLTPSQLEVEVAGTYGNIGASLVHIANAQVGYAARLLGLERNPPLPESPFPGFESLNAQFAVGNRQLLEAAAHPDMERQVEVSGDDPAGVWRMPAALILIQAVNHGTDHRSHVATILTQLGVEPPEMDGWTYFEDAGHMAEV